MGLQSSCSETVSLTGDFLNEFFKLCRRKESTDEILGRSAFEEDGKGKAKILLTYVFDSYSFHKSDLSCHFS